MIHRRKFLTVLTGLIAAPAIVKADALMKISPINSGCKIKSMEILHRRQPHDAACYYCPYIPLVSDQELEKHLGIKFITRIMK